MSEHKDDNSSLPSCIQVISLADNQKVATMPIASGGRSVKTVPARLGASDLSVESESTNNLTAPVFKRRVKNEDDQSRASSAGRGLKKKITTIFAKKEGSDKDNNTKGKRTALSRSRSRKSGRDEDAQSEALPPLSPRKKSLGRSKKRSSSKTKKEKKAEKKVDAREPTEKKSVLSSLFSKKMEEKQAPNGFKAFLEEKQSTKKDPTGFAALLAEKQGRPPPSPVQAQPKPLSMLSLQTKKGDKSVGTYEADNEKSSTEVEEETEQEEETEYTDTSESAAAFTAPPRLTKDKDSAFNFLVDDELVTDLLNKEDTRKLVEEVASLRNPAEAEKTSELMQESEPKRVQEQKQVPVGKRIPEPKRAREKLPVQKQVPVQKRAPSSVQKLVADPKRASVVAVEPKREPTRKPTESVDNMLEVDHAISAMQFRKEAGRQPPRTRSKRASPRSRGALLDNDNDDDSTNAQRKFFSCCPDSIEDTLRIIFKDDALPNCRQYEPAVLSASCAEDYLKVYATQAVKAQCGEEYSCGDDTSVFDDSIATSVEKYFWVRVDRNKDPFDDTGIAAGNTKTTTGRDRSEACEDVGSRDGTKSIDTRTEEGESMRDDRKPKPDWEREARRAIASKAKAAAVASDARSDANSTIPTKSTQRSSKEEKAAAKKLKDTAKKAKEGAKKSKETAKKSKDVSSKTNAKTPSVKKSSLKKRSTEVDRQAVKGSIVDAIEDATDSEMPSEYQNEGMLVLSNQMTPSGLSNEEVTYATGDSIIVVETVGVDTVDETMSGVGSTRSKRTKSSKTLGVEESQSSHSGFIRAELSVGGTPIKVEKKPIKNKHADDAQSVTEPQSPKSWAESRDDHPGTETVTSMLRAVRGCETYDSKLSRKEAQKREMENLKFKRRHKRNLKQRRGNDEIERARMYDDIKDKAKQVETYDILDQDRGFASQSSFDSIKSEKSITVRLQKNLFVRVMRLFLQLTDPLHPFLPLCRQCSMMLLRGLTEQLTLCWSMLSPTLARGLAL